MSEHSDDVLHPSFAGGDAPAPGASSPVGGEQRVSDPTDATTAPDPGAGSVGAGSVEGPDVETSDAAVGRGADPEHPAPESTDPLGDGASPDPDLGSPEQDDPSTRG